MNGFARACEEWMAAIKAQVMAETFGHLAPEARKVYTGYILFTHGAYGDLTPIQCHFKDLEDSPWFFEDMNEFIWEKVKPKYRSVKKTTEGGVTYTDSEQVNYTHGAVYLFTGTYRKFKNGKFRFSGKTKRLIKPDFLLDKVNQLC